MLLVCWIVGFRGVGVGLPAGGIWWVAGWFGGFRVVACVGAATLGVLPLVWVVAILVLLGLGWSW